MRVRDRLRYAMVLVAVVLPVTGCQVGEPLACTKVGADSGVGVAYRPADFPAGARLRLCADEVCRDLRATEPSAPFGLLDVVLPEAVGEQRTAVRLTVTDPASGRAVYDRTAQVTLRKFTPNGPNCEPTVWRAGLRADVRNGLVPTDD
ncbi:hypothetical protein [Streptomyces sp. NPDC058664]|uniref:hypothetical protein n=1 Tax=unclassified Streptomyces TaxID=2593676 RepID=UPI00364ADE29